MHSNRYRQLLAVFGFLAFFCQSLAAMSPPCSTATGNPPATDVVMDHSAHHSGNMDASVEATDSADCCGHVQCSMAQCASAAAAALDVAWPGSARLSAVLTMAASDSHHTVDIATPTPPPISR